MGVFAAVGSGSAVVGPGFWVEGQSPRPAVLLPVFAAVLGIPHPAWLAVASRLSVRIASRLSVRMAAAAGALAVTKSGAQDSMPYRSEVEGLLG
mgnify:CR=1 FL=1